MKQRSTGIIRLYLGFFLVFGAVGGMETMLGHEVEQTLFALLGLALMTWAVVDIAHNTRCTLKGLR